MGLRLGRRQYRASQVIGAAICAGYAAVIGVLSNRRASVLVYCAALPIVEAVIVAVATFYSGGRK